MEKPESLFHIIRNKMASDEATQEISDVLFHSYYHLTLELKSVLDASAPVEIDERTHKIDKWLEYLSMVKRNQAATFRCHIRDNSQCVVTGRLSTQGFPLEGTHIIPYAFANHPNCRTLAFWRTLDIFYGVKATDSIFDTLVANVNNLENLVSLERTTHGMFDTGYLTLTLLTMDYIPITVFNQHSGSYFLRVNYPYGSPTSGLITSTRIVGAPPGCLPVGSRLYSSHFIRSSSNKLY